MLLIKILMLLLSFMTDFCNTVSGHLAMKEMIKTKLSPLIAGPEYGNSEEYFISPDICLDLAVSHLNGLDSNFAFYKYIINYNNAQD